MTSVPKSAIARARKLRTGTTEGERRLWSELRTFRRSYGIAVRRQVPIGSYVVDFAVHSLKLVIEVDGEHHFISTGKQRDHVRDAWLRASGYRVLRVRTDELADDFDACINTILFELGLNQ